ncbi:hypothetical protein PAXRUDRAFT_20083 [Paxillus rubicundulus Ve08.2h10]|uniref:Unplaced genomic scaffold scaffold_4225, whole genome shotgun sequence n=1 Tax=Paxillus rubicundulus Ve08.2h10 TaxID=930991 RepID=A0A0D0D2R5_9AGAM|nr:hypothetical protein PAXRUDRAFT_20083 [Paxillus rubicundulus Ve08.2h10]
MVMTHALQMCRAYSPQRSSRRLVMAQSLMGIGVKFVKVSGNVQDLNAGSAVVFRPFTGTLQGRLEVSLSLLVLTVVRNWAMHGKIYVVKCQEANTTPNHLAIPPTVTIGDNDSVATISTGATQGTLEGFVQPTVKWLKEGMLKTYC